MTVDDDRKPLPAVEQRRELSFYPFKKISRQEDQETRNLGSTGGKSENVGR